MPTSWSRVTETGDESYLLLFPDTERRLFDQWLSVAFEAIIILPYARLLAHKWLGWFT
jgi:diphthamide synthase (EF-2-diphthine--ammonia ligase)